MRVFLTGATGFIGRHVARLLAARGHEVVALSRQVVNQPTDSGLADNGLADNGLADSSPSGRVRWGRWEAIAPSETLRQWDVGPNDSFLHLGWYAEPGQYIESPANVDCLVQSLELARALLARQVGQFVMAGTCLEYDTRHGWLVEDGPTAPESLYATTKLAMTATVRRLAIGGATRVATGRIFHLYGPGEDRRRVVPAAAGALLAGRRFATSAGHQIRDFLHVEDVASAFVTLLERQAEGIVNIASGEPLALRRLVERIGELVGRPELIDFGAVGLRPGEPECLAGSNAKLRSLGWRPRYGLDDGLRSYLEPFAADAVRDN